MALRGRCAVRKRHRSEGTGGGTPVSFVLYASSPPQIFTTFLTKPPPQPLTPLSLGAKLPPMINDMLYSLFGEGATVVVVIAGVTVGYGLVLRFLVPIFS